jgi:hypothetical protein
MLIVVCLLLNTIIIRVEQKIQKIEKIKKIRRKITEKTEQ